MLHEGGDQQAAETSVAVQEGVDGLELGVGQRDPDERRQPRRFGVNEALEVGKQIRYLLRGGGTKTALPGRVPPIQFCERLSSPGCLPAPRTPSSSRRWASHSGACDRQYLRVAQVVADQPEGPQVIGDLLDASGLLTGKPASSSNRSPSVAWVPSICEVSKASLRIAPYSGQLTKAPTPIPRKGARRPVPAHSGIERFGGWRGLPGGSGCGTKARTDSPKVVEAWYVPVARLL